MTNAERILAALQERGPLSDSDLRRQTGVEPHQQVNQICRRLAAQGVIWRERGPGGRILNGLSGDPSVAQRVKATSDSSVIAREHTPPLVPDRLPAPDGGTLFVIPCSGAKARGGKAGLRGPSVVDLLGGQLSGRLREARSKVASRAGTDERLLLPAGRRYEGTLYRSAARIISEESAADRLLIISGGYGLALAGEPIGHYDRRFATADWPRGLLEACLVDVASRLAVERVVALCARTTGYAELVRRVPWTRSGIEAVLLSPEMGGRGGAQVLVPRAAGEALVAMVEGEFSAQWRSTDGVPVEMERLT